MGSTRQICLICTIFILWKEPEILTRAWISSPAKRSILWTALVPIYGDHSPIQTIRIIVLVISRLTYLTTIPACSLSALSPSCPARVMYLVIPVCCLLRNGFSQSGCRITREIQFPRTYGNNIWIISRIHTARMMN